MGLLSVGYYECCVQVVEYSPYDVVAPGRISDLRVNKVYYSPPAVTLSFTSAGDDFFEGTGNRSAKKSDSTVLFSEIE